MDKNAVDQGVLVCFGNSITEGWMVAPHESWPALIGQSVPMRVINAGISGETSADGLGRIDTILSLQPSSCIVEFGINDFFNGFSVDQTRANLEQIINTFQRNGVSPGLMGFSLPQYNTRPWEETYAQVARAFDIPLLTDLFQGLRGKTGTFMPDGVHPTAKGYEIIAHNCINAFQGKLWKPSATS